MITPKHPDALHLADMAFIETQGSNADKVKAAIAAYEWAEEHKSDWFGMTVFPSLAELREAMSDDHT
jgi:hypothetical protein